MKNGRTCRAHVDSLMTDIESTIGYVFVDIRESRLTKKAREEACRRLAGVVGHCEAIRIWLDMGAPE